MSITTGSVSNVLVVPVDALLRSTSGGYAVEEVAADGVHHLVAVTTGLFDDADGLVAGQRAGACGRPARRGARRMSLAAGTPPTAPGAVVARPAGAGRAAATTSCSSSTR